MMLMYFRFSFYSFIPILVSLPLVRSKHTFTRVHFGDSDQLLLVTASPYQSLCGNYIAFISELTNKSAQAHP